MTGDYKNNSEIKWNFTKFVIDRNGNVVARFEPTIKMEEAIHSMWFLWYCGRRKA